MYKDKWPYDSANIIYLLNIKFSHIADNLIIINKIYNNLAANKFF